MDIVERLRTEQPSYVLIGDAAIEIERLREQVEFERASLRSALEELRKQDANIERLRDTLQKIVSFNDVCMKDKKEIMIFLWGLPAPH